MRELAVRARVAAAYGATHLMGESSDLAGLPAVAGGYQLPGAPILVVAGGDWAYDPRAEVWRPLALIEAGTEQEDLSADQLGDLLDAGARCPTGSPRRPWPASCAGPGRPGPSAASCSS